jgi:simple sugar transport system ATP-binding protein
MDYAVEMLDMVKHFPGVKAVDGVTLRVKKGEIHALVGENGAGKSTLVNTLYGLLRPDAGVIRINGQEVAIESSDKAIALGIGMVHQRFKLVPSFTIMENICLGAEPTRNRFFVDEEGELESVLEISEKYGLQIDPHVRVRDCPVGVQQRVEILKALYRKAEILVLDEPTAVLTPQETEALFQVLRTLVKGGKTVIFITHKLKEVMDISDSVTVMRRGKVVGNMPTSQTSPEELARLMVGREVLLRVHKRPVKAGKDPVLQVRDLIVADNRGLVAVNQVSFDVKGGEILGIAGVQGNGQTELVEAIAGLRKTERGTVRLDGQEITHAAPLARRRHGLGHIPEDRITRGLNLKATVEENLIATQHNQKPFAQNGVVNFKSRASYAQKLIEKFDIRTSSKDVLMDTLSGGNMQKAVVARETDTKPRCLIAAQPTRGVDIGSIEFIHQLLLDAREEGIAILLVSTELTEIMSLSDRIAVMYEGRIVGVVDAGTATEEELGLLMAGIVPESLKAKKEEEVL